MNLARPIGPHRWSGTLRAAAVWTSGSLALAACSSSPAEPSYGPCPPGFLKECATYELPLDPMAGARGQADGGEVPVFVARHRPGTGARGALWLVQGGPGGSAEVFGSLVRQLGSDAPDLDVYTFEQRGVGASGWLGCPEADLASSEGGVATTTDEWHRCIAEAPARVGDALRFYTLSATAEDLATLLARTRRPGQPVYLYGVSYGTAVVLRLLQLHPELVDGVVLDSVVAPGVTAFSAYDRQYDVVLGDLASLCAADEACAARLGPSPFERLRAVAVGLEAGACEGAKLTKRGLGAVVARALRSPFLRQGLLPFFYRLERCSPEDLEAVRAYLTVVLRTAMGQGGAGASDRHSDVVYANIAYSELWGEPAPSVEQLEAECDAAIACPGAVIEHARLRDGYPRYPLDALAGPWPKTTKPMLVLHGTMDVQTPHAGALAVREHAVSPALTVVSLPGATHGVVWSTPTTQEREAPCGYELLRSFVTDPRAPLDTSCVERLRPVVLAPDGADARALFGVGDAWDESAAQP